ncbi:MAG: hypothetical protein R6V15_01070, partial [Desulfotignum sp.]
MHLRGKKSDYFARLSTMNRALENGLNDVGIGALFGLYDYRFEVLALLEHSRYLDRVYGVGPHTISVPRIEPAEGAPISKDIPFPVSDREFKKVVAKHLKMKSSMPFPPMKPIFSGTKPLFNCFSTSSCLISLTSGPGNIPDENPPSACGVQPIQRARRSTALP